MNQCNCSKYSLTGGSLDVAPSKEGAQEGSDDTKQCEVNGDIAWCVALQAQSNSRLAQGTLRYGLYVPTVTEAKVRLMLGCRLGRGQNGHQQATSQCKELACHSAGCSAGG